MKPYKTITSFVAFLAIGFVAFAPALPALADCQGGWQKKAEDLKPYQYKMVINAGYVGTYLDFENLYDYNGYPYLYASTTVYSLNVYPASYQMTGTTKTHQNGYHFWVFGNKTSGTDNYFRYKDFGGSSRYSSTASTTSSFSVAGQTIYNRHWEGFDGTYTAPYSEIKIDQPKINNRIYAIIYSNIDYNYVDTEAELYQLLQDLNVIICSGGATGSWAEEAPNPNDYNFSDQDFGLVGNFFRDVILYLFKPSQENLTRFSDLKATMETKAPFAYFVSTKNSLSGFNASAIPAFTLGQSSAIVNTIFTPLKTGLTWLLWIIFGFWVIRKISSFNF
jgi:hypothetical protein